MKVKLTFPAEVIAEQTADGLQLPPIAVGMEPVDDRLETLTALYWQQAATYAAAHLAEWVPRVANSFDIAYYFASEWHDGIHVYWELSNSVQIPADVRDASLAFARSMADVGLSRACLNPPAGLKGYRGYNRGIRELALDPRVPIADQARYNAIATNIALYTDYFNPANITPKHEYWPKAWQGSAYGREFSLGVLAHLYADFGVRSNVAQASTEYVDNVVRLLLLGRYWPWWFEVLQAGYQALPVGTTSFEGRSGYIDPPGCYHEFLPFILAHSARALIAVYDRGIISDRAIPAYLTDVADLMWQHCYRVDPQTGATGLFYRANGQRTERPAPDLSMLIMPWYAWLWRRYGQLRFKDRALELLRSGLEHAWLAGPKQFNQSFLWSHEGLSWLAWEPPK